MPNIQVRDVPEPVHEEITRQANDAGLSLNKFMLRECERIARRGRNASVLRRAARRPGARLSTEQIVAMVRADRERDA